MNVNFPDPLWAQLTIAADQRGVKIAPLIAAAVMELTSGWESRTHRVQVLARAGLPDVLIAERTGEARQFIAQARRAAELPANRFERKAF